MVFSRKHTFYFIFCVLFIGLFVTVETINGKLWTNDLRVYYEAVNDYFNGNNPYEKSYGLDTGYFKYPPFTLYLFGFFSWISFPVAQIIHLSVSLFALMVSLPLLLGCVKKYVLGFEKTYSWLLFVGFLTIMVHLAREFHMGNINLILLALFSFGLYRLDDAKTGYTILAWSLMIILKPIMILAVLPLLLFGNWRTVFSIGACGLFYFILPFFHQGISGGFQLWMDWFKAIGAHGEYISSYNSFKYMSNFYLGFESSWAASFIGLILLASLAIIHKLNVKSTSFLADWIVVFVAFIPNFFVTDTEHFMLTVPLVLLTIARLMVVKKWYLWILFAIAFIPLSLNSNDFLGKTLSTAVDVHAGTGLGNFTFILLYIYLLYQPLKSAAPVRN